VERYPTLEIPATDAAAESFVRHTAVPIEFNDADFERVDKGEAITKVVYLPARKTAMQAEDGDSPVMTLASYEDAKLDVITEAQRRGAVLAVVRMGDVDLEPAQGANDASRSKPADRDKQDLQGTWLVTALETEGLRLGEGRPEIKGAKAIVEGDQLTLIDKDWRKTFQFDLAPARKPKEIDMKLRGANGAARGIYEIAGDTFKLCFTQDGAARPNEFTAAVGTKRWAYTFRRDRPANGGKTDGPLGDVAWERLGLRLAVVEAPAVSPADRELHGGMRVTAVRPTVPTADGKEQLSPAAREKLQEGDILVGLHQWETLSRDDVAFVLGYAQGAGLRTVRYVLVRNKEVIKGVFTLPAGAKVGSDGGRAQFFEETSKDFGTVEKGEVVKHRFILTNPCNVPLDITAVRSSCGCLTASTSKNTLGPNETGYVEVALDSARFSGEKTVEVLVDFALAAHEATATFYVALTVKAQN
jgi:uncharacterized protein (TIGR03067 family)